MKHIKILCALLPVTLFTIGCGKQEVPVAPEVSSDNLDSVTLAKKAQIEDLINSSPITFIGIHNYYTYASKTKEVLQDADIPAEATLTSLGGQKVRLVMTEHLGEVDRTSEFEGKLTPGGVLKFVFVVPPPEVILDIVKMHSGCTVSGPFPVYHGSFDGEKLYARTIFKSQCRVEWPANDVFETPVDGPVHWQWTMDFTKE